MNEVKFFIILLIIYFLKTDIDAYRILGVFAWSYKSHNMLFQTLMKSLAKQGHQVDVISHYELENPPENYRTILNLANLEVVLPEVQFDSVEKTKDNTDDMIASAEKGMALCALLSHEKMQHILRNPPKNPGYDLIIIEGEGLCCLYALGPFFNIPLITITASKEFPWVSELAGNPRSTAFSPMHLLGKTEINTFLDRLLNTVQSFIYTYRYYSLTEKQTEIIRKYLGPDLPSVREAEKMVALTIVNTHHSIQGIRPTTPAFIEAGGLHIEETHANFTTELKQWMDESKDGVVYFSLGTAATLESLPKEKVSAIYSSFAKFAPIRFLIKAREGKILPPGVPKNAKTLTWIPQMAVLNHNNTIGFITHGGLHSIEEAIYFATPVIGVPLFIDQYQNVEILVNKNMGVQLNYDEITEPILTEALTKILRDSKYREAAKYHSRLFRDRPMSPMKTVIFWIEYVIRNGAGPLRSPALDLYWWQQELLDVYGFLLLCFILPLYLIFIRVKLIVKKHTAKYSNLTKQKVCFLVRSKMRQGVGASERRRNRKTRSVLERSVAESTSTLKLRIHFFIVKLTTKMKSIQYFVTLLILFLTTEISAYRILGVFPVGYTSHNILFQSLMKGLARRGHQVDVISHYEPKDTPENYKTILNLATINADTPKSTFDSIQEPIGIFKDTVKTSERLLGFHICEQMAHKEIQQIIKNPPTDPGYDIVITEGLAANCYYAWGHIFNVPVVSITASMELPWVANNVGNPLSTAFFPTLPVAKLEIKTFWDRLQNTLQAKIAIYRFLSFTENQSEVIKKYLSPNIRSIREAERMVALTLVNTHYSMQGVRPTTPAFIEIAGLHIEEDESKLTRGLKRWMDESKDGVVYVALGTTMPLEILSKKILQAIYSSFAKLAPIKVLMKKSRGHKFPPGLPKNVLTMPWIPQIPILGHNNTKVFITHGGIHSVQEAIYFAVPIIGIPVFYDQYLNIEIAVKKKMGIQLIHDKITEESLDEALMKILTDPIYREAARNSSKLFRDRPMSPMDTTAFWIEYTMRNGAQPLRSPALDLYWWQTELLDVYGFLLSCSLITIYLFYIMIKAAFKMCFGKNPKPQLKRD
ncbi:uncharacterized protein LOC117170059 [Belonocnema kinseyi]|uniref:uncharacterized protein LOC117170059 n=1 Tax=Belonocnema kinseyi TaxID=2817044 RepID=UPI00143DD993|nr:uncharacterized protein LOC117170059 [Belonocnema kinseyi]